MECGYDEGYVTARKAMSRLSMHPRILFGDNLKSAVNIKSLHCLNVPDFYGALNDTNSVHLALRMLILTGVRSDSVNNMRFDQIENGVWTIPNAQVKGRLQFVEDFKVPLSVREADVEATTILANMVMDSFVRHLKRMMTEIAFRTGPPLGLPADRKIELHLPIWTSRAATTACALRLTVDGSKANRRLSGHAQIDQTQIDETL